MCRSNNHLPESRLIPSRPIRLGAGIGVAGILLARLGATVTLTDNVPEVLALLRRNVAENGVGDRTRVERLAWEDLKLFHVNCSAHAAQLDMIIGSDLVYGGSTRHGELLLAAIAQLLHLFGHPRTTVLLGFGNSARGTAEHLRFVHEASKTYVVNHVELVDSVGRLSAIPLGEDAEIIELTQRMPHPDGENS